LTIRRFFLHLALILAIVVLILMAVIFWLRNYTNHGQKLELPDYVGTKFIDAEKDADDKSFQLIINDSIHIVGKAGGEILDQNPKPYSKVKENRKIYVTTSKYTADEVSNLPALYGRDFHDKKRELSFLNIECEVRDYLYDPGEPDHILEVWYDGKKIISRSGKSANIIIKKGDKLEFVLSSKGGGQVEIPDLKCKKLEIAKFILENSELKLGVVNRDGDIENQDQAYIIDQYPSFTSGASINMGSSIDITISQKKPEICN